MIYIDLYDLYVQKRPLYDLRHRLIDFLNLRDLTDKLRFRFTKTGYDQFKEGVDYITLLKFLKRLFENWDDRNRLLILRKYLKKWNDKARKLKEREDRLKDALDEIEKRQKDNLLKMLKQLQMLK